MASRKRDDLDLEMQLPRGRGNAAEGGAGGGVGGETGEGNPVSIDGAAAGERRTFRRRMRGQDSNAATDAPSGEGTSGGKLDSAEGLDAAPKTLGSDRDRDRDAAERDQKQGAKEIELSIKVPDDSRRDIVRINEAENMAKDISAVEQSFFDDQERSHPLEPLRTDPLEVLRNRQRRLERVSALTIPEFHCVGQIVSCRHVIRDASEGVYCRWKIEFGKAWQHISGDVLGQTQVAYPRIHDTEELVFNHPIDVHFVQAGIQGMAAPRLLVQCSRIDWYGRRILAGYGFVPIPQLPGHHQLEVPLWRPAGSIEEEMEAFFLGTSPALVDADPIYHSAWRDRCRLVTTSAGTVNLEVFVVTRHYQAQGLDYAKDLIMS